MSGDEAKGTTIAYIRNVIESLTEEDLKNKFASHFTVISCRIVNSGRVDLGRIGQVIFQDNKHSDEGLEIDLTCDDLFDFMPLHLKIRCLTCTEEYRQVNLSNKNAEKIFVKNLVPSINADDLRSLFGRFGTIRSANIAMENGRSRGFGFVTFATHSEARLAVRAMNLTAVSGQRLNVSPALPSGYKGPGLRLDLFTQSVLYTDPRTPESAADLRFMANAFSSGPDDTGASGTSGHAG